MLQRLGFCFLSCILSLAATAAEPARNLPNVRAITSFVEKSEPGTVSWLCRGAA
jgi:hypothetical protein